jgi:hypothetical protein
MIFLRPIEIGLACEFLAASGDLHGRFFSRARASSRFRTAKTQRRPTLSGSLPKLSVEHRIASSVLREALAERRILFGDFDNVHEHVPRPDAGVLTSSSAIRRNTIG